MGISTKKEITDAVIRTAYASVASVAIFQVQDILGLGNEARMNTPSTVGNNWKWRMPAGALTSEHAKKLVKLATLYGRLPEED